MQTFGTRNLLCQWIPKFNYALCEKLFWGLKYLTSFHFMLLILLLWLKANTEYAFTMSKCATSRGGTGPRPVPLPGQRPRLIPCAEVIPALGAHFPSLSAPFQLEGKEQVPKEGMQWHCFLVYSVFFQFNYHLWHYSTEIFSKLATATARFPSWVLIIRHILTYYQLLS